MRNLNHNDHNQNTNAYQHSKQNKSLLTSPVNNKNKILNNKNLIASAYVDNKYKK
jgi:hypothetical protein